MLKIGICLLGLLLLCACNGNGRSHDSGHGFYGGVETGGTLR